MVRRWTGFRNPWEREYAMRGALWRGVASADPLQPHVPRGALVLELGCGDGKFLAGLRAAGYRGLGVDSARRALALARKKGHADVLQADVRALPFGAASVSAVAARYVLGAMATRDRVATALEIERVLAPGGSLFVEEFARGDFREGNGREVEPGTYERNRGILTHYFDTHELPPLLARCRVESLQAVSGRQRTPAGLKPRRLLRWILRRQALNSSRVEEDRGAS